MSRYAWLVCEEEKEMIFLGKIVKDSETDSTYFHRGPGGTIKNSENQLFTKAIFKFFGTHIGKVIRVVPEEELERYTDASFVEIDGDPGPSLETYIEHFKG